MNPLKHPHLPDTSFDGGDMDCGNGLLLMIRRNIDPLPRGGLLEILSTETSVREDLPAWCRMTGNALVSFLEEGKRMSFLVCKGTLEERASAAFSSTSAAPVQVIREVSIPKELPAPAPAPRFMISSSPACTWNAAAGDIAFTIECGAS